jgi:hypothetical protein
MSNLTPMLMLGLIVNGHGLLVLSPVTHAPAGYQRVSVMPTRCQQSRMMCSLPSDADLFAALRQRMAAQESDAAPAPLGPDDVGADQMGPADVVSYIMKSMKAAQEVPEQGLKALMAFAAKTGGDKAEDHVGQVQPGYFSEPSALAGYLAANPRYQTLLKLSEWKPMGPPDLSNLSRSAVQKVLVRREGSNWEDLFVNMQLAEIKGDQGELSTRRWLITTIYKQGAP